MNEWTDRQIEKLVHLKRLKNKSGKPTQNINFYMKQTKPSFIQFITFRVKKQIRMVINLT